MEIIANWKEDGCEAYKYTLFPVHSQQHKNAFIHTLAPDSHRNSYDLQ